MSAMAVVTVTGDPGCRADEVSRLVAKRLGFEWVPEFALRRMVVEEYGSESSIPDRAKPAALAALLARAGCEHHLVLCGPGAEALVSAVSGGLRVRVTAPIRYRTGTLMIEHNLDQAGASRLLHQLDAEESLLRKRQFGRARPRPDEIDLAINSEGLDCDQIAQIVEHAARVRLLPESGFVPLALAADLEFAARLRLARHGITRAGRARIQKKRFANESEAIFANLLDFYRIGWEYEPRTFPLDANESFTPDFYLPEFDLYVELTTMRQSLVTRKNRKVKLLRALYPNLNIQVFYQKDFQNLIFKHGLADRPAAV